jgi:hypothetical protein
MDLTNKRVYISFDSKSLGDSIAWIPYVLEFKKKHDCKVIVYMGNNNTRSSAKTTTGSTSACCGSVQYAPNNSN